MAGPNDDQDALVVMADKARNIAVDPEVPVVPGAHESVGAEVVARRAIQEVADKVVPVPGAEALRAVEMHECFPQRPDRLERVVLTVDRRETRLPVDCRKRPRRERLLSARPLLLGHCGIEGSRRGVDGRDATEAEPAREPETDLIRLVAQGVHPVSGVHAEEGVEPRLP